MQITCATVEAAGQVLFILMGAQLQPIRDFEIRPVIRLVPPVIFTPLVVLPATLLDRVRALPDSTIVG
jgi:predicted permease